MTAGGAATREGLVRTPAGTPAFAPPATRAGTAHADETPAGGRPLTSGAPAGARGTLAPRSTVAEALPAQATAPRAERSARSARHGQATEPGASARADGPAAPSRSGSARPGSRLRSMLPQLLLVTLCGGYAIGAMFGWGSEQVSLFMGDFGLAAAGMLAAVSCIRYARTLRGTQLRPAWLLFGLSALMAAAGNAVWGWYEVVLREPVPHPSAADFCFLLFAPPAIIGLLVLAKRPVTRAGWVCLGLDSWLIGGSLLTISWSLALVHTTYWDGDSVSAAALSLAYPLLDIVLVSMVLALHFRRSAAHRSAINTAVGALATTVLCDALFTSPMLREHYTSGQLLDAGWFAGALLLAYAPWVKAERESARETVGGSREAAATTSAAAVAGREALHGDVPSRPIAGSLTALTPYLAAAVCTLGILYNAVAGREIDRVVLFTACTVVLALVVRQGIMLLDNISLTQELAQKENHFRSLVQGSSDVIMIASPTGMLRYVSPAAAGVYGRDGDALIGTELAALIHPEDLSRVLHELRRFLATPQHEEPSTRIECRFRHGRGHWLNVESTVNRYRSGLIFNSRDVTERVRLQAQLQHNASHDPLTDLPNRALFTERVRKALVGRRGGDSEHAVLYIDLDGFKAVNDTIGHQGGDELLVAAARRLQDSVRAGDTAARLGGDEFAVLILGDGNPSTHADGERELRIHEIADRLRMTLSEPYRVEGHEVCVAASIGIAFAEPGISPTALMRNADLAMYRAKQGGKARVELYSPRMQQESGATSGGRHEDDATSCPAAAASASPSSASDSPASASGSCPSSSSSTEAVLPQPGGEFTLLHQPVVELAGGKITAVSALPRRRSAQGVLFTPEEFRRTGGEGERAVPAQAHHAARPAAVCGEAVQHGGTAETGRRLLEEAVQQAVARQGAGFPVPVSVRLPVACVVRPAKGVSIVEAVLARQSLPPGSLILELTGADARIPLEELAARLSALHRLGVRIALDGFGSGPLPVSALRRLPVDIVRLERSLVEGLADSVRQRKITKGLLRIAGDLGLMSVAEGVDHPEQAARLREMGCTHAQGALFSGPLDEHRLRHALSRGVLPEPLPEERTTARGAPGRGRAAGAKGAPAPGGRSGHGSGQRGGGRSVVVAGALPVRMQERRENMPPWLVSGDMRESVEPARPPLPCPHAETPVPPT